MITHVKHIYAEKGEVKCDGFMNPVTGAAYLLQISGQPIDEASFERVAAIVGDKLNEENGFVVTEESGIQEALMKLCDIGNFVITCNDFSVMLPVFVAMLPEEFQAKKDNEK